PGKHDAPSRRYRIESRRRHDSQGLVLSNKRRIAMHYHVPRSEFCPHHLPECCSQIRYADGPQLGGVRHFHLPSFAARFQAAGFAVLLYDNRNWGDSDGLPRQESIPALQQTDYYDAFNYAICLPNVDRHRMVYWGTSFSG